MKNYILAVDGGGTKTALRLVRVINESCSLLEESLAAASSLTQQGLLGIEVINDAIEKILSKNQIHSKQVYISIGVAGAGNELLKNRLASSLSKYPYYSITTDAHISLLGANLGAPINVVAIGTGTVAMQLTEEGEIKQYGGWGFPIGDQGGGAWIGQQAIRSLLKAYDTNDMSILSENVKMALDFCVDKSSILDWLKKATATDYAKLAPNVISLAKENETESKMIINQAHQHIYTLIRMCCDCNSQNLVLLGSLGRVFKPLIYQYLLSIDKSWKHRLINPQGNALDGAILFARKKLTLMDIS